MICYGMEKDKKRTRFVYQPEYPGGPKELTKFIYQHLRYPRDAFEANIEGTVYVEYDIDYQGIVVGAKVLKGLGHGCDEEAMRVVKLLKFDVARNRGIHVLFHQKVRVQFKKPKPQPKPAPVPAPAQVQVAYTLAPATPPPAEEAPKQAPSTTYNYTIKIG
jgi:TonB family protein